MELLNLRILKTNEKTSFINYYNHFILCLSVGRVRSRYLFSR